jgi:hypothetical protein
MVGQSIGDAKCVCASTVLTNPMRRVPQERNCLAIAAGMGVVCVREFIIILFAI